MNWEKKKTKRCLEIEKAENFETLQIKVMEKMIDSMGKENDNIGFKVI